MGRPSKLTEDAQRTICRLIEVGNTVEVAADAAGIGEETFYGWMRRGERSGKANAPHREFRAAIEQARATAEATMVTRIAKAAANGSWQAAAWLLERRAPERWAKGREGKNDDGDEAERPKNPAAAIRDDLAQRRAARAG